MGDVGLRALERATHAGDAAARVALLRARQRAGLDVDRFALAALCFDRDAANALYNEPTVLRFIVRDARGRFHALSGDHAPTGGTQYAACGVRLAAGRIVEPGIPRCKRCRVSGRSAAHPFTHAWSAAIADGASPDRAGRTWRWNVSTHDEASPMLRQVAVRIVLAATKAMLRAVGDHDSQPHRPGTCGRDVDACNALRSAAVGHIEVERLVRAAARWARVPNDVMRRAAVAALDVVARVTAGDSLLARQWKIIPGRLLREPRPTPYSLSEDLPIALDYIATHAGERVVIDAIAREVAPWALGLHDPLVAG